MMSSRSLWDLQKIIGAFHLYAMITNGGILLFYLLRYPSIYFNLLQPSHPPTRLITIGILSMPCYYLFESLTTMGLCQAMHHSVCKFIIHHLLTISISVVVYQNGFFNACSFAIEGTHGLMSLGYYYSPNLKYIMCRWYAFTALFTLAFSIWSCIYNKEYRSGCIQVLVIGVALSYNNYRTPELVVFCQSNPAVTLSGTSEYFIHIIGFCAYFGLIAKYSKRKEEKLSV